MWESTDAIAGSPERYGDGDGVYGLGLGIQTSVDSLDSTGTDAVIPIEEMGVLTYASIASGATAGSVTGAECMGRRARGDFSTNTTPTVAQQAGGGGGGSFQEVEEEVEEDEELRNIGAVRKAVTASSNSSPAPNFLTSHTRPFPLNADGRGDDATYHTRDTHSPALSEVSGGDGDGDGHGDLDPQRSEQNPFANNNSNNNNNNAGTSAHTHIDSVGGGVSSNPFARVPSDTNPFVSTQPCASNNPFSNGTADAAMHMQQPAYSPDDVDPMAATLKSGVGTANPFANPHYQRSALEQGAHKEDMQQQQQQQQQMSSKTMGGSGGGGGGGGGGSGEMEDLNLLTHTHEQQQESPMAWIKGELIGEGTFGSVYKGMVQATGELIGIKQLGFVDGSSSEIESLRHEIDVMWKLDHPNIVRYLGTDHSDRYFYILLEYVPGGSIASMLSQYGPFSEDLVRRFSYQILRGLAYLHKVGIVHRDIKGANVLVSSEGVAKVADFGCSKQLLGLCTSSLEESLKAIRGSVPWMAPEVHVYTHTHAHTRAHT
jgi:mitogen-activated protein kinase kinase kinase